MYDPEGFDSGKSDSLYFASTLHSSSVQEFCGALQYVHLCCHPQTSITAFHLLDVRHCVWPAAGHVSVVYTAACDLADTADTLLATAACALAHVGPRCGQTIPPSLPPSPAASAKREPLCEMPCLARCLTHIAPQCVAPQGAQLTPQLWSRHCWSLPPGTPHTA